MNVGGHLYGQLQLVRTAPGGHPDLAVLADGFGLDELYAGASATGSQAFLVPDGETVLIRVSPGYFGDEVFVQP